MKRVAILVSGGGSNLQALIDAREKGEVPSARLVLVVSSNKDAYALKRAEHAGIPAVTLHREDHQQSDAYDAEMLALLRSHNVEMVVLAGFLNILGPTLLKAYPRAIINMHPSLIPAFSGPGCYGIFVHQKALARGVKLSGATVHFVNDEIDGGEIILQKAVDVLPGDTPEVLQKRIMEQAEWVLLPKAVELVCKEDA